MVSLGLSFMMFYGFIGSVFYDVSRVIGSAFHDVLMVSLGLSFMMF